MSQDGIMFRVPERSSSATFYVVVVEIIFLLKAVILVRGGEFYGRLGAPPVYDDATYFVDGLQRARLLLDQGVYAFLQNLIDNPPHAHYSSIAAAIAFLFGGPERAGAYLMNAVTAAALVALLFRLFRVRKLTTVVNAFLLASTSWFDNVVTWFHPDLVAGLATGVIAAVLVWQAEIVLTRKDAVTTGVVAAIFLFIKPVAFAMVLGVWSVALMVGSAIAWHEEKSLRQTRMRLLFGVVPLLLIATPYFARELPAIFDYFMLGFVREREVWSFRLAPSEHTMYYVNQARLNFDRWFLLGIAGAVAIMGLSAASGDRTTILRFAGLIVTTFAAYIVPQVLDVKHYLYGGPFYGCVAVCLVLVVHYLADRLRWNLSLVRLEPLRSAVLGERGVRQVFLGLIVVVAALGVSDKQMRFGPSLLRASQVEYDGVYGLMKEIYWAKFGQDGGQSPLSSLTTYFLLPAPVAPHAYTFRGLVDGINIIPNFAAHETDLQTVIDGASQATVVIVPDDETMKMIYPYMAKKLIPAFRVWIAQNSKYKLAGTIYTNIGSVNVFTDVPLRRDGELKR